MTDKDILNLRVVGGDYFKLIYSRRSNKKLPDFLPLFSFDDYWCYKGTDKFREVDYQDFINFKYSCYTFFRKDLYRKEYIDKWIEYMIGLGKMKFLNKPTPPFPPEKIIIRK
jgi:hypothetical protein